MDAATIFEGLQPSPEHSDDAMGMLALKQAVEATKGGNYGVGAVLLDENSKLVGDAGNRVHDGGKFRSDLHAEMVLLNTFEEIQQSIPPNLSAYTLISSLEPCPMCMTRIIFAGIGNIKYICPDDIGGMCQRHNSLPPIFKQLSKQQGQQWQVADCSKDLRAAAFDIWDASRAQLDEKVVNRSKGS